jgi:hypothetical protein
MKLLQCNSCIFQTDDLKTLYNLIGIFKFDNTILEITPNHIIINDIILSYNKIPKQIGGSFWLSTIAMLLFISKNKNIFKDKTILELGAGLALPSNYIQKVCNPKNITASDYECLTNKIKHIDWNNLDDSDNTKYDIIIACDCIYRNSYSYLLQTIKKYLVKNGKLFIINPYRDGLDDFIYGIREFNHNINIKIENLIYSSNANNYTIELYVIRI